MNNLKKEHSEKKVISIKTKLALVYIFAGFLPVLVILIVNFIQMKNLFKNKEISNFNTFMTQAVNTLDNQIKRYDNLANYISYDYTIHDILYSEDNICDKFEKIINPSFESMLKLHTDINSIKIYYNDEKMNGGSYLYAISEIEDKPWFYLTKKDNSNYWWVSATTKEAILIRKIDVLDVEGKEGVLCINIDYDKMVSPFTENTNDNFGLFISDRYNNAIFQTSCFEDKGNEMTFEEMLHEYIYNSTKYRILKKESEATDWIVWIYKPEKFITLPVEEITIITVAGIVICLLAAFMCIRFTAIFVTQRISKLQRAVFLIEQEDFSVSLTSKSNDEIGELINSFSRMEKKLNYLINEVYKSKINEKEYEMKALQAQINPHFLYNTLSLINWKAIEAGQKDISKITLALSAFYRTSLNKGNNVIKLAGEIENMRSYLSIQLMLHDDDFDVIEDIDESLLGYNSLNLILQPLLENAIDHGLDVLPDNKRGRIEISVKEENDEIVMSVTDNGIGMDKEQTQKILTKESKGYGVRNVNERIKLYYGENYPLCIRSRPGEGTSVIITIPKKI